MAGVEITGFVDKDFETIKKEIEDAEKVVKALEKLLDNRFNESE